MPCFNKPINNNIYSLYNETTNNVTLINTSSLVNDTGNVVLNTNGGINVTYDYNNGNVIIQ